MPKVKAGTLTPKQAKYVEAKAAGLPGYRAAMLAYDTTSVDVANQISRDNLQKAPIKEAIEKSMATHALSMDDIALVTRRQLDYKGMTDRDTLDVNGKGADRLMRLIQMTEDKTPTGNTTLIFNNNQKTKKYVDNEG